MNNLISKYITYTLSEKPFMTVLKINMSCKPQFLLNIDDINYNIVITYLIITYQFKSTP